MIQTVQSCSDDTITVPLHWENITLHFTFGLGLCCHTTDGISIKKGNYLFYVDLQGHMYVHVESLPGFRFHFIKW